MRILLASTAAFIPPRGGSTRANRVWLDRLCARGHACRVVCGTAPAGTPEERARIEQEAERQGLSPEFAASDARIGLPSGIEVFQRENLALRTDELSRHVREFVPDWVLVSSEDIGHALLRQASDAAPGRVVYLAHTPQFFPFGPESWAPDPRGAQRVRNAAAVVAIGPHMAGYVRQHLGRDAVVIHPPVYGSGPFPDYANFDIGHVLMVNPCAVKGISIFTALADVFSSCAFAALPGWGTTPADRDRLQRLSNFTLLDPVPRIENALIAARVLLVPSLWYEGFGLIVMEAMLHGIPVIASNSGGLVDAKRGTEFVVPIEPIREYRPVFDEAHLPRPVIPKQRMELWEYSLQTLLTDKNVYRRESRASVHAARSFVSSIDPDGLESLLANLTPAPSGLPLNPSPLSPARRDLLLSRLRARRPDR